jgi:hypothetical protein
MGQQETVNAQKQANDDWVAYQRTAANKAAAADEANRQKATAALTTAEQKLSPASQEAAQQTAATDLNTQMLAGSPAAPDSNITLLGGEPADTNVSTDMAQRVTSAAREAQGRIKALAGITSYGGGYNDMGAAANQALSTSNENINLASDFRKGDTQTLGVAQQVEPLHYVQGSNIAGTVADTLASAAGSAFASKYKGFGKTP